MQMSTATAGTFEIRIARMEHMAALIAYKASVQPRHHGPELNARNAIGTAHNFVDHKKSAIQAGKYIRSTSTMSPRLS